VSLALALGLQPSDLKLLTGLFVIVMLAIPVLAGRGTLLGRF
jgi:putative tryptophan/tyrosine transport system permease protein